MEFKIAVIGKKLYGDLGLIINDATRPPQLEKGFVDQELKDLMTKGLNNLPVTDVFARNREGNQIISYRQMKDLAD
jgi:hypothetical protein